MTYPITTFSRCIDRLSSAQAVAVGVVGALVVGEIDYLTGYEIGMGLFYLAPLAVTAWGAGKRPGILVAALCCVLWYLANRAAGAVYSNPLIPVWNALIRLGFFLVVGLLLATLRERMRELRRLAMTDALTGLFSRHALEARLAHDIALSQRHQSALTLAYMDVDAFKAVNDTYSHAQGDRLLRLVGDVLVQTTRKTDTAARVGGDEFVVVMPDTDSRNAGEVIAKLARELQAAFEASGLQTTCSIGVATFPDTAGLLPSSAIAAADALMYRVKRKGKGAVEFAVLSDTARPAGEADAPPVASD